LLLLLVVVVLVLLLSSLLIDNFDFCYHYFYHHHRPRVHRHNFLTSLAVPVGKLKLIVALNKQQKGHLYPSRTSPSLRWMILCYVGQNNLDKGRHTSAPPEMFD
jgi:hypothetical protein